MKAMYAPEELKKVTSKLYLHNITFFYLGGNYILNVMTPNSEAYTKENIIAEMTKYLLCPNFVTVRNNRYFKFEKHGNSYYIALIEYSYEYNQGNIVYNETTLSNSIDVLFYSDSVEKI